MKQRKLAGTVILMLGAAPTVLWIMGAVGWIDPVAEWPVILITLLTTGVGTELVREKEARIYKLLASVIGRGDGAA